MSKKEIMIAGLRRQRELLAELIQEIQGKKSLVDVNCERYDDITRKVEKNLKELHQLVAEEVSRIEKVDSN